MSFGVSVGDFLAVGQFCWKTYKKCKDSPGNYKQLSGEVGALHNVIKETEELLSQQDLTDKQKDKLRDSRLRCEEVLKDLDALLAKYDRMGTKSQRTFDRMGFGMADMDSIRGRLTLNVTLLDAFNNASSNARLEDKLNILIAEVRSGKREGSVVSTKTVDSITRNNQETWDALRRDLEDVGVSPVVISEKRDFIITWFREAVLLGKLEEVASEDDEESDGALADSSNGDVMERNDWSSDSISYDAPRRTSRHISEDDEESNSAVIDPKYAELEEQNHPAKDNDSIVVYRQTSEPDPHESATGHLNARSRLNASYLLDKLKPKPKRLDTTFFNAYRSGDFFERKRLLDSNPEADVNIKEPSDGKSLLHLASLEDQIEIVQLLLARGVKVDTKDSCERTPLYFASINGYFRIAQLLLYHGAKVDAKDDSSQTSLLRACEIPQTKIVRLLLNHEARVDTQDCSGRTPLHEASHYGHTEVAQLLLHHGIDVHIQDSYGRTSMHVAWVHIQDSYERTSLHVACERGHIEIARLLLKHGANVRIQDSYGRTAFYIACERGHTKTAQLLLDHGAEVDAEDGSLHRASENGYTEIAELLLDHGAEVSVTNFIRGQAPLHRASIFRKSAVAELLLNRGAEVDAADNYGRTPLYEACCRPQGVDIVRLLLSRGANIDAYANSMKSVLFAALDYGDDQVVQLLLERGARIETLGARRAALGVKTLMSIARERPSVVKFLEAAGAKW